MNTPTKVQDVYKLTDIWLHFAAIASPEKLVLVTRLVDNASAILDRIIETFPTYTIHNGQHQLNILNLYGQLLGGQKEGSAMARTTDLEAAILILSAFYHDIGMVFKDDERAGLEHDTYFEQFLAANIKAKLTIAEDKEISRDIAEWYCRWCHAKRVWTYLNPIDKELVWEGNHFRRQLAEVCLSHNERAEYLKEDTLDAKFWNSCDLKFCAIMLRLADVLDFDDTRAPVSLFHFLGLDNPNTGREEVSSEEFQKHIASKGFEFNHWSREHNYTLVYKATPTVPEIEHDINDFLDYIERELRECSSILSFCSERWKSFMLPDKIDRQNIKSQGYTYGNFRFSLDQEQVLSLLMGESLYDDKFVFIRELLQNAIDTGRHRKFYELNKGNKDYEPKAIEVSTWHDAEGYRWVKFEDFGMGMSFSQVSKYFLKVGNSYYNSDEFKLEKLRYKTKDHHDFTPISRFGIGVLSCFMVGDLVEVNTLSIFADGKTIHPVRLSLKGLHGYYVMQTDKDIPADMPGKHAIAKGYRKEAGTSITIRIKPNNDLPGFILSEILDSNLFNSEIPVWEVDGGRKGVYVTSTNNPNLKVIGYNFNNEQIEAMKNYTADHNMPPVELKLGIVPTSLNKNFSHPNIKGLLYIFYLEDAAQTKSRYLDWLSISYYNREVRIRAEGDKDKQNLNLNVSDALKCIDIFNVNSILGRPSSIVLSHNGIIIPKSTLQLNLNNTSTEIVGYIELSDYLRPQLSVSRSSIVSIPWALWSALNYTIRRNIPEELKHLTPIDFLNNYVIKIDTSKLEDDPLIYDRNCWASEKIFRKKISGNSAFSFFDIINDNLTIAGFDRDRTPANLLRKKIIAVFATYKISLCREKKSWRTRYDIVKRSIIMIAENELPKQSYLPLTFCEYENFEGLMPELLDNQIFNSKHPFSKWLMNTYDHLEKHYENHLHILMNNHNMGIVNTTIAKLRMLLPEGLKPPVDLQLTKDDFKVDIDSLPMWEGE